MLAMPEKRRSTAWGDWALVRWSLCFILLSVGARGDLVNTRVQRRVDLDLAVPVAETRLSIKNVGSAPATKFHLLTTKSSETRTVVRIGGPNGQAVNLEEDDIDGAPEDAIALAVPVDIPAGETVDVQITSTLFRAAVPAPAEIREREAQYLRFTDTFHFFSPYATEEQTTKLTLPSRTVTSHSTNVDPVSLDGSSLVLGPYHDVGAFRREAFAVRYKHPRGLVTAKSFRKRISVSHWGAIGVVEEYELWNPGPRAAFEVQRLHPGFDMPAVSRVVAHLPVSATDVQYRDLVGNVTTSNLQRPGTKSRKLEMEFRYPMWGGWKTFFWYSYKLNLLQYLQGGSQSGEFALRVNFEPTMLPAPAIEDFGVTIVLPEGSRDVEVEFPSGLDFDNESQALTFPTLSMSGSPTLHYESRFYSPGHLDSRMLTVRYVYPRAQQLKAPMSVSLFFLACFAAVIAYGRLDVFGGYAVPNSPTKP